MAVLLMSALFLMLIPIAWLCTYDLNFDETSKEKNKENE